MNKYLKNRALEIVGFVINGILISKYFLEKTSIQCEPCFTDDCPPCQTEYMKNIWIYLIIFNSLLVVALILKNRRK